MDSTITGTITNVRGPQPVLDRTTGQPTGATEIIFEVTEQGETYPDSVVLRIYEKDGGTTKLSKAFESYPGFQGAIQVGMPGTFHFHLRGKMGVSQTSGKPYAINDCFMCWKAEAPAVQQQAAPMQFAQQSAQAPVFQQPMQQQFAPQQFVQQQPWQQPQQSFQQQAPFYQM